MVNQKKLKLVKQASWGCSNSLGFSRSFFHHLVERVRGQFGLARAVYADKDPC